MDLTTTANLETYLRTCSIPFVTVTLITTGAANYVWRLTSPSPSPSPSTPNSIIKHCTPYLRINASIALPLERQHHEATALASLPPLLPGPLVRLPTLLHYDSENHVLQIADAGSSTLHDAFAGRRLDLAALGARLGVWLAGLHACTARPPLETVPGSRAVAQYSTRNLGPALRKIGRNGAAAAAADAVADFLAEEGDEERFGWCHGDFMPQNVIVADGDEDGMSTPVLTVIDWEWTRWGNGAFDVGMFAGEAWLLEFFSGKLGTQVLLEPFLEAYVGQRELTDEEKWKAAARFAVQITYWPMTGRWGHEKIEDAMEMATEVLEKVAARDVEWLKTGGLAMLFKDLD